MWCDAHHGLSDLPAAVSFVIFGLLAFGSPGLGLSVLRRRRQPPRSCMHDRSLSSCSLRACLLSTDESVVDRSASVSAATIALRSSDVRTTRASPTMVHVQASRLKSTASARSRPRPCSTNAPRCVLEPTRSPARLVLRDREGVRPRSPLFGPDWIHEIKARRLSPSGLPRRRRRGAAALAERHRLERPLSADRRSGG